jgi:hypothetical protein
VAFGAARIWQEKIETQQHKGFLTLLDIGREENISKHFKTWSYNNSET